MEELLFIVHVFVQVKEDCIEAFREASLENARHSIEEPGILRFDVIQERERADQFVLVEVYRTPDDPAKHKETAHYLKWRETVADMMAVPRSARKYLAHYPATEMGWDTAR